MDSSSILYSLYGLWSSFYAGHNPGLCHQALPCTPWFHEHGETYDESMKLRFQICASFSVSHRRGGRQCWRLWQHPKGIKHNCAMRKYGRVDPRSILYIHSSNLTCHWFNIYSNFYCKINKVKLVYMIQAKAQWYVEGGSTRMATHWKKLSARQIVLLLVAK